MKFVLENTQCDEGVHVQKVLHGKSARISETCLLVRDAAFFPRSITGRPVTGSAMMRTFFDRILRGVRTTRPLSMLASRESPGRRPSLLRIGMGSTTCPLVETLVCMVRQSYLLSVAITTLAFPTKACRQFSR